MWYEIEKTFREELFFRASKLAGGDEALGRRLGYRWNYGFRVKQLRDGKFGISVAKLKLLSETAGVGIDDVLQHAKKVFSKGKDSS